MATQCPNCGDTFERLGHHLHYCGQPDISDKREILVGMLLGDARIDQSNMRWIMINEDFMSWLDDRLGWLSTGVRVFRTPEEVRENMGDVVSDTCNVSTQYETNTRVLDVFGDWRDRFYPNGEKRFPDDLTLTDEIIRFWYVCDGTLNRGRVEIRASNFEDDADQIEQAFAAAGYTVTFQSNNKIVMRTDDSARFFDQTEPLPGFGHKWPDSA